MSISCNTKSNWQLFSAIYMILQGLLCFAWWGGLYFSKDFNALFLPIIEAPIIMQILVLPDLVLIGSISILFGIRKLCNKCNGILPGVLIGAIMYATLASVAIWMITPKLWLGLIIMLIAMTGTCLAVNPKKWIHNDENL